MEQSHHFEDICYTIQKIDKSRKYKIKNGEPTPCISNIRVDEVWNKIKSLLNE